MGFFIGALHIAGRCHMHKKQVAQEAVRAASAGSGTCGGARAHWLACTESEGRSIEGDRGLCGDTLEYSGVYRKCRAILGSVGFK